MKSILLILFIVLCLPMAKASTDEYVEMLSHPSKYWGGRKQGKLEFEAGPALSPEVQNKKEALEQVLETYAPRMWWHPNEPFTPEDPLEFIQKSSLWAKRRWAPSKQVFLAGQVQAQDLSPKLKGQASQNLFLKFEDKTLGTGEERDWAHADLKGKEYRKPFDQGRVPLFWKLGTSHVLDKISKPEAAGTKRVLIEYWYHLTYSYATKYDIGNHQGDWEGFSVLLDLGENAEHKLNHKLVAVYFAHHDGGSWHCPSELTWSEGHLESFTALGTHATYHREGKFKSTFITDVTARGRNWDTWRQLRPIENEPYYGYEGLWGDSRLFAFMSGPRAPDPIHKALPHHSSKLMPPRCGT